METQEDHLLRVLNMSMMCNLEKKKEKDFLKHVVGTNIEMNNNIETEQYLHLEVEEVRHEMELVKVSLKSLVEIQNEIF